MLEGGLPVGVLGKIGTRDLSRNPQNSLRHRRGRQHARHAAGRAPGRDRPPANRRAVGRWATSSIAPTMRERPGDRSARAAFGGRANYYGQVIVDPNDADRVFVLSSGADLSEDGGRTWRRTFRYAGDNHVLWIDPADSNHMMLGYDYGFATTNDAGANWVHADELPLAQLYAIGVDMDYPYNVYGGLQDFGSWRGPSSKKGRFPIRFEDWEHMQGGDGFYNLVDPTNSRWLYSSSQFGGLSRVDQKTGVRRSISLVT